MLRGVMTLAVGMVVVLGMAALGPGAAAKAPSTHPCPTFTGPGDNLVHSKNFRVARISCSTGKRVVEGCDQRGTPCRIGEATWHCRGRIPGEVRCTSGRRVAEIYWDD
jgi:hypothetical protein